ncbi:STAS domain-containing protein [Streptomyces sp. NPDC093085]|uniref:STAS domain-containing protein n=1 Tax=Streptomyces sp. NPDC093085 TaxID=3155068 RepID=UPI003420B30B
MVTRRTGDAVVLTVGGDLDLETIAPLAAAVTEAAATGAGPVVVDLSGVTFADSTTVNVLLRARGSLGPRLRLARPSAFVRRLFDVIGLEQALPVYATVEAALVPAPTEPVGPPGLPAPRERPELSERGGPSEAGAVG